MQLRTANLCKRFGGIVALHELSVTFLGGTISAVIGPNGAGKSTLFNAIAGFLRPDSGAVYLLPNLNGVDTVSANIVGLPPEVLAMRGIGTLFQDTRVFAGLSAIQNVMVGAKRQPGENPFNCFFRRGVVNRRESEVQATARAYLCEVGLNDAANCLAGELSFGQQKLVAIARLMSGEPHVALLDEPTVGLHPDSLERLLRLIDRIAHVEGRAVIMIEHNLDAVRRVADCVHLMIEGRIATSGKPAEVLSQAASLKAISAI